MRFARIIALNLMCTIQLLIQELYKNTQRIKLLTYDASTNTVTIFCGSYKKSIYMYLFLKLNYIT